MSPVDAQRSVERALALETSTRPGSVALFWAGRSEHATLDRDRSHARDLFPCIDALLDRVDAHGHSAELEVVYVGIGPGSYTGLRVGIATALGLARAVGAAAVGIPSIEALALRALHGGETGSIALDARGGRFYFARYARGEGSLETLAEPACVTAAELRAAIGPDDAILGDSTVAEAAQLDGGARERLRIDLLPQASAVLELGLARGSVPEEAARQELEPLYLRAFGQR